MFAIESSTYKYIRTHSCLLLTFKNEVKDLRANQKTADKTEKTLKGQLDKMSTELEKVKRLKEEAEVSDVWFSSFDITSTVWCIQCI